MFEERDDVCLRSSLSPLSESFIMNGLEDEISRSLFNDKQSTYA